jgi:hypothetical protein
MESVEGLAQCEPSYRLLEEARKSWEYAVSDEVVYIHDASKVAGDSFAHVPENYVKGHLWIECHLTFVFQRNAYHLLVVIECDRSVKLPRHPGKIENSFVAMNRDASVLVDVTEAVEPPEQMRRWVRSLVLESGVKTGLQG